MKLPSSYLVLLFLAGAALCAFARPPPQIKHQQQTLADLLGEEITALISAEERIDAAADDDSSSSISSAELRFAPARRPLRDAEDSSQQAPNRAWLRFFSDFMNNQKKFRGRTKKTTSQGCFGFKLDRIGSFSGLGC
ncbi:C-type natriuretic peptide-like [Ambystoma mexicanum]|uniref:C-type natriuretic peptide-like n=1 Tax=Ambystoma mexicanum TaxID=8296 RepID=UPI0037E9B3A7